MEKRADKKAREIAEANLIKEIKMCVSDGNYDKALEIISEIDIPRLKGTSNLILIGEVYMKEKMYDDAASVFMKAYNKAPNNRRILELLTDLYIEKGDYSEAEYYYKEFIAVASRDVHRYILRYRLDKAKGERSAVLIDTLEHLKDYEYMEEWAVELAQLYHKAGEDEKAVRECDEIQLWFGHGPYVNQALRLKAEITGEDIPIIEDYEAAYDDSDDEDQPVHTGFTDATIDIDLIEQILNEQEAKKKGTADVQEAEADPETAVTDEAQIEADAVATDSTEITEPEAVPEMSVEAEADEQVTGSEELDASVEAQPLVDAVESEDTTSEESFEIDDLDDGDEAPAAEVEITLEDDSSDTETDDEAHDELITLSFDGDDEDDFGDSFDEPENEEISKEDAKEKLFEELSTDNKVMDFWGKRKKKTRRFFKKRSVDEIARDQMVAEASKSAGIQNTGPLPEDDFLSSLRRDADMQLDEILNMADEDEAAEVAESTVEDLAPEQESAAEILAEDLDDDDEDEMITESEMSDLFSEEDFAEDEDEIISDDMMDKAEDLFDMDDFDEDDASEIEAIEIDTEEIEATENDTTAIEAAEIDATVFEVAEPEAIVDAPAEEVVIEDSPVEEVPDEEVVLEAEPVPEIKPATVSDETMEIEIIPEMFDESSSKPSSFTETDFDDDDDDVIEERIWTEDDKTFINGLFSESKTSTDLFATVPNIDYVKEQLNKTFTKFDEFESDSFDILAEYDINFIVLAGDKAVKSQIALGIAKALNTYGMCEKSKLVRASAQDLNGRDFSIVFEKLKGGCLIIDNAHELDDKSAEIIEKYVMDEGQQTAIVFSSTNEEIIGFWKKHQSLRAKFLNVINVSKYNEMELVNLAKGYIEQKHYELDPESALILRDYFKRCLDADEVVNYEDVMSIVDVAITHLENRNVKNLFMTVLDNKYEEAKMFKLLPMDFAMLR